MFFVAFFVGFVESLENQQTYYRIPSIKQRAREQRKLKRLSSVDLFDGTFDQTLEELANKGVKHAEQTVKDARTAEQFEAKMNEEILRKQEKYYQLLQAARKVIEMGGVRRQVRGSDYQKKLQKLLQELVEPTV